MTISQEGSIRNFDLLEGGRAAPPPVSLTSTREEKTDTPVKVTSSGMACAENVMRRAYKLDFAIAPLGSRGETVALSINYVFLLAKFLGAFNQKDPMAKFQYFKLCVGDETSSDFISLLPGDTSDSKLEEHSRMIKYPSTSTLEARLDSLRLLYGPHFKKNWLVDELLAVFSMLASLQEKYGVYPLVDSKQFRPVFTSVFGDLSNENVLRESVQV